MVAQISEGNFTSTIYGYIKEKKYNEAIEVLTLQRYAHPNSRAALSLLAFCYFQTQDFVQASDCYEQLSQLCPNHPTYRLHFALCLHRAGLNEAAMQVAASLAAETEQSEKKERVVKLQAAIRYSGDDFTGAGAFVHQCSAEDPDTGINVGCLLYRGGKYSEACKRFQQSLSVGLLDSSFGHPLYPRLLRSTNFLDCRIPIYFGIQRCTVLLSDEAIRPSTEVHCRYH